MSKLDKRAISIFVIAILALSFVLPYVAVSAQVAAVTPATGGGTISADDFGTGAWTLLTGPVVTETAAGEISTGTIVLTAPAGFDFNPAQPVTIVDGTGDIVFESFIVSPTQSSITFNVITISQSISTLTFTDIDVRPNTGTLSTGEITRTGGATGLPASGYGTLTMVPGAATTLTVEGISDPFIAGVVSDVTITALDQYDNIATGYTGTITFTSSDVGAETSLPADYTFVGGDAGTHLLVGSVTLTTIGEQWVTAEDTVTPSIAGTQSGISVVEPTIEFTIDYVSKDVVQYGDVVTVWGSGVTSGSTVELYWDTAVGTGAYFLNSTTGKNDGSFECDFDVPSDVVGNHYIWVKDVATLTTVRSNAITMDPKIKLSPSSGLETDDVTIKGYGFADEVDITLITFTPDDYMGDFTTSPSVPDTDELGYWKATFKVPTGLASTSYTVKATDVDSNLAEATFTFGASISFDVDEGSVGTVVEISGRGFSENPLAPDVIKQGDIYVEDGADEKACYILDLPTDGHEVDDDGEFDLEIVIPQVSDVDDYKIFVKASITDLISTEFTVTGLAEIKTEYAYGVQTNEIKIEGWNFTKISGKKVQLDLMHHYPLADLVPHLELPDIAEFETDSKGYFSGTFNVPVRSSDKYILKAFQVNYDIEDSIGFRIGLMLIDISPESGPTGTKVVITGFGFSEDGYWNATFGGLPVVEDGEIDEDTNLGTGEPGEIPTFIVPTLPLGIYTLVVNDITEVVEEVTNPNIISLEINFLVTETTTLVTDPMVAPNKYPVKVEGKYFSAEPETDVEFVIYNVTADGKVDKHWDMDMDPVETDKDGNFTGLWTVPDNEDMSVGDYTINATDDDGLFAQYIFSVVAKTVEIEPRKSSFAMGETVHFDVESSFAMYPSYIEIYDPYDNLYWRTDDFLEEDWLKVGTIERVPYYQQTAGGNPMTLMDATVGPWFWEMFYDDEAVCNGTFEVTPAPSDILTDRINALSGELALLADDITDVTDEIAGDIADLSSDISDVEANVQDMIDDITADLAEELAGVAADTEAAVDELEGSIGDIAAAQNALQSELEDMGQDTAAAREAAEDAQRTSQGVTTLVYGAIAASLIAALAAIVSLMQISKKIA